MSTNKFIAIEIQKRKMKPIIDKIVVELFPDKAPHHVQRILDFAHEGFYKGKTFHRVIDGFMAQGGCPKGDGTGSSSKPNLIAEFNDIKHVEGVMSMARSSEKDSGNCQFFIMLNSAPYLDFEYTAFGKVIDGMQHVHGITKGDRSSGIVKDPSVIIDFYECDANGNHINTFDGI